MDTHEDLTAFRTTVKGLLSELDDSAHVLIYDSPTRGIWWERLEQLMADAEELAKTCRNVKDHA